MHTGDHVLAYNQALGSTGSYTVTAILVNHDPAIEYLTLDGETLTTTPEHPFFTQERGWTPAGALVQGDHVRKADGSYGLVQRVKVVAQPSTMYNLTVAVAHTFFVGQQHWLVHNTCGDNQSGYIGPERQLPSGEDKLIHGMPAQQYPHPRSIPASLGRHVRGDAGQEALERLYGPGNPQQSFPTSVLMEARHVDLVVQIGNRTYAYESNVVQRPLAGNWSKIKEAYKDFELKQTLKGYTPIWIFWDQGLANGRVAELLNRFNISAVIYHP